MPEPVQVVLVEHEMPSEAEAEEVTRRLDRCLELRGARWMRSYVTPDRRRSLCEFEAPDGESVREAFRTAGLSFDRAWVANMHRREP